MDKSLFRRQRLRSQRLAGNALDDPVDAARWLLAVQSQDYAGGKWAIGLRWRSGSDAALDEIIDRGDLIRTHILRPTWHFVAPEDLRWLLELTSPRVRRVIAATERSLELDDALLRRAHSIWERALRGGAQLTRAELAERLAREGIQAEGPRLGAIVMRAELDGLICSGARKGTQFTYALLEERVPLAKRRAREEALAEIARRFFTSHGPATPHDLSRWASLTVTDCKRALEMVKSELVEETYDGGSYWLTEGSVEAPATPPSAILLPNYDEHFGVYAQRDMILDPEHAKRLDPVHQRGFPHWMALDGQIIGQWSRKPSKRKTQVALNPFRPLSAAEKSAFADAARRYEEFLGTPVEID